MPTQPPLLPTVPFSELVLLAEHPGVSAGLVPTPVGHNHASFLALSPEGDLWCAWFGGSHEGRPDVSIYLARLPLGSDRWEDAVQVTDDVERSEQNPVVWFPAPGMIELLYTAQLFGSQDTALIRSRRSSDGGRSWTEPRDLFSEPGLFIRQRPIRLGDGDILLPIFRCTVLPGRVWKGDADVSLVARSRDDGHSWAMTEVPDSTGLVHMDILPTNRAGELVGLFRSRWADYIYRSESLDSGSSWTTPRRTNLPNNNSSIQTARLDDGRFVIAYNDVNAEISQPAAVSEDPTKMVAPGEIAPLEREAVWGVRRVPLALAVSHDEGNNWRRVVVLEAGTDSAAEALWPGLPDDAEMSYPSIVAASDRIWVSYSYDRLAIKSVGLSVGMLDV